jgi:Acetyltransferase (GNAT) family
MRSRSPTSSSLLRKFAEDPNPFLPRAAGTRGVDTPRYFAVVAPDWVSVSRVRVAPSEVGEAVGEVRELATGARSVTWQVRPELAGPLRALGFGDPDPPNEPRFFALALDHEPPGAKGVEVRHVETFADFLAGLEVSFAAAPRLPADEARERARAADDYERRRSRPGGEWLALVDGRPAGYAAAIACAQGLFLAGGATAPWARRRGCYRALVRARWDDAVARGTPALAVHAQAHTSRPILERLGFEPVCELHELEDRAR